MKTKKENKEIIKEPVNGNVGFEESNPSNDNGTSNPLYDPEHVNTPNKPEKKEGIRKDYFKKYDIASVLVFSVITVLAWLVGLEPDMALVASFAIYTLFHIGNNFKKWLGHKMDGNVMTLLAIENMIAIWITFKLIS